MAHRKGDRAGVLHAVSNWLKLLGLIVLAAEAVLIVGLTSGSASSPMKGWYIPLMLTFLCVIVVGLFLDRHAQLRLGANDGTRHGTGERRSSRAQSSEHDSRLEASMLLDA